MSTAYDALAPRRYSAEGSHLAEPVLNAAEVLAQGAREHILVRPEVALLSLTAGEGAPDLRVQVPAELVP